MVGGKSHVFRQRWGGGKVLERESASVLEKLAIGAQKVKKKIGARNILLPDRRRLSIGDFPRAVATFDNFFWMVPTFTGSPATFPGSKPTFSELAPTFLSLEPTFPISSETFLGQLSRFGGSWVIGDLS